MCIPSQLGCNGELNCLEGDASDETGCQPSPSSPSYMMMTMIYDDNGGDDDAGNGGDTDIMTTVVMYRSHSKPKWRNGSVMGDD